jgi:hypothetical protein
MNLLYIKIAAFVLLAVGHAGMAFMPEQALFSLPANLAFVLIALALVEGLNHTQNKKRYILILAALAFITDIPHHIAFHYGAGENISLIRITFGNLFYTLLAGAVCILVFQKISSVERDVEIHAGTYVTMRAIDRSPFLFIFTMIPVVVLAVITNALGTVNGGWGVALIYGLAAFKNWKRYAVVAGYAVLLYFAEAFGLPSLFNARGDYEPFLTFNATGFLFILGGLLALVPVYLYNGKREDKMEWLFIAAYPAMLCVLAVFALLRA